MIKLDKNKKYVLALSGGIDSVVLLDLLIKAEHDFRCVHVNHTQTQRDDRWEEFVVELCKNNDIALEVLRVTLTEDGHGLEAAARQSRYSIISENISTDEILLTGHHKDDNVETILFNLIRGTGISGASGMKQEISNYGMTIVRPMLALSKIQISDYAFVNFLKYYEDETNSDDAYTRNYLRNNVIPTIDRRFKMFKDNLLAFADKNADANDLLYDLYQIDKQKYNRQIYFGEEGFFDSVELEKLSHNRLSNLLHWYIKETFNLVFTTVTIDSIINLIFDKRKLRTASLSTKGIKVTKDGTIIHFQKA